MDAPSATRFSAALTGLACCLGAVDSSSYLKSRKQLKFMGKQDQLAVVAASQAAARAGLTPQQLASAGLYLVVGHIPFEEEDMLPLARESTEDGLFSMERFSSNGLDQVNPLLTFRCLPNMPAFHVSLNLGIQGPSFTTYPGLGQFYQALEQALWALHEGQIDVALVGAVADQNNFLVDYHWGRHGILSERHDVAGFLCLQRHGSTRLVDFSLAYTGQRGEATAYGPADLIWQLGQGNLIHRAHTLDGLLCNSRWLPS